MRELRARVTSGELTELLAYQRLMMPREDRQDWRVAQQTQVLLSPHLKKGTRTRIEDFKLQVNAPKGASTQAEALAQAQKFKAAFGGKGYGKITVRDKDGNEEVQ